jgi:hypothetical protein
MQQSIPVILWFAKYALGGVVSYLTPRVLVAFGVPLDRWVMTVAGVDRETALLASGFVVAIALYVGSVVLSREHNWSPSVPTALKKRMALIEPLHIVILGLLIALGGVAWQMIGTSRPKPTTAELQSRAQDHNTDRSAAPPQWQALVRERRLLEFNKRLDEATAQSNERWEGVKGNYLRVHPDSLITQKGQRWSVDEWRKTASGLQSMAREALGDDKIDMFDMSKFESHIPTELDKSLRQRSERGEISVEYAEYLIGEFRKLSYQKRKMESALGEARFRLTGELAQTQQTIMYMGLQDDLTKAAK